MCHLKYLKITVKAMIYFFVAMNNVFAQELTPRLCEKYRAIDVQSIYSCQGNDQEVVYLQMFLCEDCPVHYFNKDKVFIAKCCVAKCVEESSSQCKELAERNCDFEINHYQDMCAQIK